MYAKIVIVVMSGAAMMAPPAPARAGPGEKAADQPSWVAPMREVHARFTGRRGTFAHFGDSITITLAFWTPLLYARKNAPPEMEQAFAEVKQAMRAECWRDWKGARFGSDGGMTSRWALENVDGWLKTLNPEVVLLMFGTNDLAAMDLAEYDRNMRQVVRRCLENGTVVILSTIPPRTRHAEKAAQFSAALRRIAADLKVPLTDYHAEILRRRRDDWDGAAEKFSPYEGYDVPTLLSRDGVHPSHPVKYRDDYSEEALDRCGFSLRNYMVLMRYADVLGAVWPPGSLQVASSQPAPGKAPPGPPGKAPPGPPAAPAVERAWFPKAPPLPPPGGEVIRAGSVEELFAAAGRVRPGGTILLADGHYMMPRYLELRTDGVTLRGASGERRRVVLDGARSSHGELVGISRCAGVTIADLTIQNVKWNGFKLNSDTNVQRVTIRNCVIHNVWQRGVKGVIVPKEDRERTRPGLCRVQYCLFYNDRPKAFLDDEADTARNFGGNYVGGIDVMYARDWTISDNVFVGIRGRTGEARGAVFVWVDSRDCIIERNVIIDCDSGICLGNSFRHEGTAVHCTGVVVRNNFVTRAHENGILADYTRDCKIVHNTIHDPQSRLGRLIRLVHDNDGLVVANNLLSGPPIRNESASRITLTRNWTMPWASFFADAAQGDLHLTPAAKDVIGKADPAFSVPDDIDGRRRNAPADIGADQAAATQPPSAQPASARSPSGVRAR